MTLADEVFLADLRNTYIKIGKPLIMSRVYDIGKKTFSDANNIRFSLKRLHQNGLIKLNVLNMTVEPQIIEETREIIKHESPISEIKIRHIVRLLGKAKPNEIYQKFIKIYGIVNAETLTRMVRTLHEEGTLKRNENNEYFLDNESITKPLIFYT